MRTEDCERLTKHIFRHYRRGYDGKRTYVPEDIVKVVLQSAIDLGIVRLNEDAKPVIPYSQEKVI